MADYHAPVQDMRFVLEELCDLDGLAALPDFGDLSGDLVGQILDESARFTGEVLAPLNRVGDTQASVLVEPGVVRTPDGFKQAYAEMVEGGWNSTAFPTKHGGMGLPWAVTMAIMEMWQSANLAWSLCPQLTIGALEALIAHAEPALRDKFLPKLMTGEWAGTMNLTEPQAGTDLALLRTRAERNGDHYLIKGQKIFITYGEHDLTENICHLVLARLPDAPPGVKGISLFLVPKYLVNDDGSLGARNDAFAVKLEHKLGIHASPTCVMQYGDNGGAVGYLIGHEHDGLRCMFTMMNNARLGVGLQGLSMAERAYQQAVAYARERVQSAAVSGDGSSVAIINHPDVRRMLMTMRSHIEAMRALAYYTNAALDRARHHTDPAVRRRDHARMDLLTPVVKAWCTDIGFDLASLGVQMHGGMGFIEETGAAQHLRDARIAQIYEGTNGIQANDLLGRKLLRDGGAGMTALIEEIEASLPDIEAGGAALGSMARNLRDGVSALRTATEWLLDPGNNDLDRKFAGAVPFLHLTGTVVGGWLMAKAGLAAQRRAQTANGDAGFYEAKLISARFYADHALPQARMLLARITAGGDSVLAMPIDAF
jgi:alkylation response protein AidB-like acyl-CoA dehydrogenase